MSSFWIMSKLYSSECRVPSRCQPCRHSTCPHPQWPPCLWVPWADCLHWPGDQHPPYQHHHVLIHQDTQVLMPGGPKLTPNDPEKKKVMEKWVNQGAMIMRSVTQRSLIAITLPKNYTLLGRCRLCKCFHSLRILQNNWCYVILRLTFAHKLCRQNN